MTVSEGGLTILKKGKEKSRTDPEGGEDSAEMHMSVVNWKREKT